MQHSRANTVDATYSTCREECHEAAKTSAGIAASWGTSAAIVQSRISSNMLRPVSVLLGTARTTNQSRKIFNYASKWRCDLTAIGICCPLLL